MKKFFYIAILTFFALSGSADYHDPNSHWDYDEDHDGDRSAYAMASKYYNDDTIDHYGFGSAYNSGNDWADFTVSIAIGGVMDGHSGKMRDTGISIDGSITSDDSYSVDGYGNCGEATASASE